MEATSPPGFRSGSRHRPAPLPVGRTRAPLRSAGTRRTAALESSGAAGACATHQTRPAGTGGGSGEAAAPPPGPARRPQEAGRRPGPGGEREQEALGPELVQSQGTSGVRGVGSRSCSNFTWRAGSSKACCGGLGGAGVQPRGAGVCGGANRR